MPNPLSWMVTFSDLITLLLTFFVLLISMSSMDVKSVRSTFAMFSGSSGVLEYAELGPVPELGQYVEKILDQPSSMILDFQEVKERLLQFDDIDARKLLDLVDQDITIKRDKRGLVITLSDYILFTEGSSELRLEFLDILSHVADILASTRLPVSVEGHTDASPMEGGAGTWAWELSLDRAISVVEYFTRDKGMLPERFRVAGLGPSQPVVPNDSPKNRTRNRRIEIIIYHEGLS